MRGGGGLCGNPLCDESGHPCVAVLASEDSWPVVRGVTGVDVVLGAGDRQRAELGGAAEWDDGGRGADQHQRRELWAAGRRPDRVLWPQQHTVHCADGGVAGDTPLAAIHVAAGPWHQHSSACVSGRAVVQHGCELFLLVSHDIVGEVCVWLPRVEHHAEGAGCQLWGVLLPEADGTGASEQWDLRVFAGFRGTGDSVGFCNLQQQLHAELQHFGKLHVHVL